METMEKAYESMAALNKSARDCMVSYRVHSCTDITGFGLLGHSFEMAQGSNAALEIHTSAITFIPKVKELAAQGNFPGGLSRNRMYSEKFVDPGTVDQLTQDLLFDPETSGGLLISVDPQDAETLLSDLQGKVPCAQRIGRVIERTGEPYIYMK